ncbi:FAD-dependent oxidoreductase [Afifella sp. H1R]|uniref:FAD-dependent oxidoreductase n=1 Tax=Afifella sp. H1R TaxID=2908841 RepID=UPI001F348A43|nr:FAD-dependent oxidoreductase [Afifella sp. H1R]MCF1505502.1 FAD-dependent oxidoreductase [Afifella sp. H1R]
MSDANRVDLAIVGAGPAGMTAAIAARRHGLKVAVFDEQPAPGGQIYRDVETAEAGRSAILGADYVAGRPLAEAFRESGASYYPRATVWRLASDGLSWSAPAGGDEIAAERILVAGGAMERPFPAKGWTLPGVMTAGAAQILLKSEGVVADDAVFIGCGPLLALVACQYLKAGVRIRAILDTTPPQNRMAALRHLPKALAAPGMLSKGIGMLARIAASPVAVYRRVESVELVGDGHLAAVRWRDPQGFHEIEAERAFLHQGIIPNLNMTMAAGCRHVWDERQLAFRPETDAFGHTSLAWLMSAGDGAGIAGAKAAALSGEIAGHTVAHDLERLDGASFEAATVPLLKARRRERALRPFLDALYRPAQSMRVPEDDDVVVCRCEEVRRGEIARAVAEGCPGPNQLKSFTRAGMGPCQGRLCGHTVVETIAALSGAAPEAVGYYRSRMPLKPVTVGEIAGLSFENNLREKSHG